MPTESYALRVRLADGEERLEPVPPSQFGLSHEHKAKVAFRNAAFPLRKARASATVELLKDGEVMETEVVTPNDKHIETTRAIPGHAHTRIWGSFSGPVTREDIEEWLYHPMFGGRDLSINWHGKTFYGVRHDD